MSNYELERHLPVAKNVIGMMEDELGGEIMKEFVSLRPTMYSLKKDNYTQGKSAKGTEIVWLNVKLILKTIKFV